MADSVNKNLKNRFKLGVIWSVAGQFGALGITFITNIFLARLLGPEEFGVIAIAMFFIALANVLTESGLSGALVRKVDATDVDNSTIFIFNLTVSLLLYLLLYISSHKIEAFYSIDSLSLYLKVLGLVLIVNSFRIIQHVRLVKELRYKEISIYAVISIVVSSFVAIIMAFNGYGIWSLITLQILNSVISASIYWVREDGLSTFRFSLSSFKELYVFGFFTTLSSLLNTGFNNIYQMILGKNFTLNQTGYFYQSQKLTDVPTGVVSSLTQGVVFSTLANLQNDQENFDKMYNNIIRIFTSIAGLLCLLIFLFPKEILYVFYGEKWIHASFYMQILAASGFFYMQELFNRVLFKVFNKTSRIFYLELIKKGLLLITILLGVYYKSIEMLMYGYFVVSVLSYFLNYYVSRKVYTPQSKTSEFKYTIIVLSIMIVLIVVYTIIKTKLELNLLFNLTLLPLVLILFLLLLQVTKIINIKEDIALFKKLDKES